MADSGTKAAKAGLAYTVGNVLLKGIAFLTLPIFFTHSHNRRVRIL